MIFTKRLLLPLILVVTTWCASSINWGGENWKTLIISDGKGYYAYLPAVFIYNDLNLGFYETIEDTYYSEHTRSDYRSTANGKVIDKYFCGSALAMLPFFTLAHGLTLITGGPADGYSQLYPVFVSIAAIFWMLTGLVFVRRVLRLYGISEGVTALVLLALAFGTNLFYYTIREPAMSHVYAFAFTALFVYSSQMLFESGKGKYIYLSALFLGMIVLIRPVNGLMVLALPFLAGGTAPLASLLKRKELIASVIVFLAVCSIQLILYKISTGSFFIDAYSNEGFILSEPNVLNFLFSYKKGFLLYTPFFLALLAGLFVLFRQSRFRFWAFTLFFFVVVYLLSSWWMWYYGGSFGSRVMIDYYPLLVVPVAMAFQHFWQTKMRAAVIGFSLVTIFICQVQTFQYRYSHIHWGLMDKEHYWRAFMRIDLLIKGQNPNADLLGSGHEHPDKAQEQ